MAMRLGWVGWIRCGGLGGGGGCLGVGGQLRAYMMMSQSKM